jgi:hypothetical protein
VTVILSPLLLPPNVRRRFETELAAARDEIVTLLARCAELGGNQVVTVGDTRCLDQLAYQSEDRARTLPALLRSTRLAVDRNPLRRRDRQPLLESEPIVDLAIGVATATALMAHECADLATRGDLKSEWASLSEPMSTVLRAVAPVIDRQLDPKSAARTADPDLARAVRSFRKWQSADPRPAAAVLRHSTRRLLEVLDTDPAHTL